jgi:two-component system chemotaxis response regulator CheB
MLRRTSGANFAKVKSLGARRGTRSPRRNGVVHPAAAGIGAVGATAAVPPRAPAPITLRPFATVVPQAVLVGASTGGPRALNALVAGLAPVIGRAAVLIAQHMPPTFTAILAEHLARAAGRPAAEAVDGEPVVPGRIYLAPGGLHMRIEHADHAARIALDDRPPVHFCRPAVDPLFSSAASAFGPAVVAVILTGMGADGALGAADIAAAGGSVIAQDETTSVVWGMPGAAAHAGLCSAVLPLGDIAPRVVRLFAGGRG